MADRSRIEELRLRLQKDPGSIAFAQLAEEYRRAGRYRDAIHACQAGLARHPGYLSARVTLGRALIEVGELDGAHRELTAVLRLAPENLSAIRGLAEVHRKRGELPEALEQFKSAFELAGKDPAVEDAVRTLRRDGAAHPSPTPAPAPAAWFASPTPAPAARLASPTPAPAARLASPTPAPAARLASPTPAPAARFASPTPAPAPAAWFASPTPAPAARPASPTLRAPEEPQARRMTAYLSRWLEAIVADRRARLYGARA